MTTRLAVRVRPGASRTAVGGRYDGPWGPALLVVVTAPAEQGKANEAVRRALASALGLRRWQLEVVRGRPSRDKLVDVTDPPPDLEQRVAALRDDAP